MLKTHTNPSSSINTKSNTTTPQPAVDDNKITREEFRNIVKSMDKKEFENYMGDYIKEISNPDNVLEQNQFLKNAEENKDLPQNVKLAQPRKGFCIKSEKFSIKRPGIRQKVYINICQLDEIKPPEEDSIRKGMWSLPHLVNKGRNDQDKKGNLCTTYDIVFNPKAIDMSNQFASFKKFVCDTSISAINNNLLKSEQEKLSNDFVVKSKFDYKGKEVAIMNVHSLYKSELDSRKEPKENFKTSIQKEIEEKKNKKEDENDIQEDENDKVFDKPDVDVEISEKEVQEMEAEAKKKLENSLATNSLNLTPIYKIKYSTDFQLHKHFYLPSSVEEKNSEKLLIEIEVPKMDNLNQAEVELDKKKLHFRYKDIYLMDIDLPSEIDKEKSEAKFDRKKNLLTISASMIKKNDKDANNLYKKEDDNVEIIKDNDSEYEHEEKSNLNKAVDNSQEINQINNKIKSQPMNKNELDINNREPELYNETKCSELNLNPDLKKDNNENKLNEDNITNQSYAFDEEKFKETHEKNQLETFNKKSNNPYLNFQEEKSSNTNESSTDIIHQDIKPKITEIPKEHDEDDVVNNQMEQPIEIPKNHNQNDLIKISYINFNCDMIYEID